MPIKVPRLVRDNKTGIFYFRFTLPRRIASAIHQTSIYTSLRTRNQKQARAIATLLNYGIEMSKPIDLSKIRQLIKINLDEGVFEADTADEQERGLKILEQMAKLRSISMSARIAGEPQHFAPNARTAASLPAAIAAAPVASPNRVVRKMSEVVPMYMQEAEATLAPATVYKHQQSLKLFLGQADDRIVDDYSKEDIKSFKTRMLNEGKVAHTINQYLSHIKSFFQFSSGNGYSDEKTNPVDGMFIKHAKNNIKRREMFYDDDLAVIFDWRHYRKFAIKPDYFWGPLMCLYSGMRIEDATSIELSDIKEQDGVVFFRVSDAKTEAGNRNIPVHSKLIELGFLDFVKMSTSVKNRENDRLFWYLVDGHNGTKKNLSRRFSEHLVKIGVKDPTTCFHSLRHTVITRLATLNVNSSTLFQLTGHVDKMNAHFDYLHPIPMPHLKQAIDMLDFHDRLDFANFNHRLAFTVF